MRMDLLNEWIGYLSPSNWTEGEIRTRIQKKYDLRAERTGPTHQKDLEALK